MITVNGIAGVFLYAYDPKRLAETWKAITLSSTSPSKCFSRDHKVCYNVLVVTR